MGVVKSNKKFEGLLSLCYCYHVCEGGRMVL